jgi:carboxymethylenebutenolidase
MGEMKTIGTIPGYEVQPTGECKGGLIVIHEVWGLSDHIKDVAERFAAEGYLVLAPNLLTDTDVEDHITEQMPKDLFNPETRNALQPKLREIMTPLQSPEFATSTNEKLRNCFKYLYDQPLTKQKVAVVGYCFGGTYSFNLAAQEPKLRAAVPYYGHADMTVEDLRAISCPILAFYGEKDERLMSALPELEEKMHEARVDFTVQVYADAGHAFFNDSNPYAYNQEAAKDAWVRTLAFLEQAVSL